MHIKYTFQCSVRCMFAAIGIAVVVLSGCTGTGSIDSAESLGLSAAPDAAIPAAPATTPVSKLPADDALYAGLPTGPKDTGTFPTFGAQPEARIIAPSQAETDQLIQQLEALEAAQTAGTVSPAIYNQRLAELKKLAAEHSPAMLRRIESRQPN